MKNKIKLLNLVAITYLFTLTPVQAALDVDRLDKARASITAKHYHHGYAQFKKMANHGCPFSQCILGIMHKNGTGVEKNASQAIYWFQKSAAQGFADAEKRLGLMYYQGDGVKQDLNLAKEWLSKAAAHGEGEAQELLAQIPQIPEPASSNSFNQSPQSASSTLDNIRQSWQGYADVTKQLELAAGAASSQ